MGRVTRVNGPLVEVDDLPDAAMSDLVTLGEARLPAEIVAIGHRGVTTQAYEYTGGLSAGSPVTSTGRPLSARLGPGLLGGVFDGLLRPLDGAPAWLSPGATRHDTRDAQWSFRPAASRGQHVGPGETVGDVTGDGPVPYRILVPAGVSGTIDDIAPAGQYAADAVVATVAGVPVPLTSPWPMRTPRPYRERVTDDEPLHTGLRGIDLLFPILKGSTAAVPGGFGTGKTMLLQQIAKWCDADVIVYVGCGERGNEMAEVVAELFELTDPRTGGRLADRTVTIANTSNMPMMAREASIHSGVAVAEYFRDMGYHVVVIADSTSRWAEALREYASRSGALPAEEGFPAHLGSAIAAFYERAGTVVTLGGARGSVTVVGAVSPPGGDMTEPVTVQTQRFVRCLWTLDRELAYARHYPAVSWSASFSRDADIIAAHQARHGDPEWGTRRARAMALLAEADRLTALADLVGISALPDPERVSILIGRLLREGVLQQNALSALDASCSPARGGALIDAVLVTGDRCRDVVSAGGAGLAGSSISRIDSISRIEETDFGPLLRARDEAPNPAAIAECRDKVLAALS